MHYRTPGKTGFEVSEIGYSTRGIGKAGWTDADDEQSLNALNLGLEAVDIQQFHVWSSEWLGQGDWLEGVQRLKAHRWVRKVYE